MEPRGLSPWASDAIFYKNAQGVLACVIISWKYNENGGNTVEIRWKCSFHASQLFQNGALTKFSCQAYY